MIPGGLHRLGTSQANTRFLPRRAIWDALHPRRLWGSPGPVSKGPNEYCEHLRWCTVTPQGPRNGITMIVPERYLLATGEPV